MLERLSDPWRAYVELTRLDKPIGTLLLLWPTWAALWLAAEGVPDIKLLVIFSLGTWLARSAGCVINDIVDRDLDGAVARTSARPLANKRVPTSSALVLCALLFLAAFLLVLLTNALTITLAIGGLAIACCYPFVKRISNYPQLVLGIAFSWGIPMAFAAQTAAMPEANGWTLVVASMLWIVMYDTEYAMADRPDDIKIGIKSTAIAFGKWDRFMVGLLQVASLACLLLLARIAELGALFLASVALILALFVYQQHLIRARDPDACFRAFKHNNFVGLALFAGVALDISLRQ